MLELAAPTRTALLGAGVVGLGSAVDPVALHRLGGRPFVLGLLSWVLPAGGTLLGGLVVVRS